MAWAVVARPVCVQTTCIKQEEAAAITTLSLVSSWQGIQHKEEEAGVAHPKFLFFLSCCILTLSLCSGTWALQSLLISLCYLEVPSFTVMPCLEATLKCFQCLGLH